MQKIALTELTAVSAVAAHKSFRAAAAALDISPSALSHAVAALEKRIGVRLFNRTTRSVSLSPAGEQFLSRVTPALQEISDAMEAVNDHRDTPSGTLRLNSSEIGARLIQPIILAFLDRYPEMSIDLAAQGRFVDIVAGGFDAGVRLAEAVPQDMIAVKLTEDLSFAVVGSPVYFADHDIPLVPADLLHHRCVRARLPSGKLFPWEFQRHGETEIIDVPGQLTLDNDTLKLEAALAGGGLTYISAEVIAGHLADGRLVRVLQDWTPSFPGLCLYYPGRRHVSAGLRAFIAVAREVLADHKKKPGLSPGFQMDRPQP